MSCQTVQEDSYVVVVKFPKSPGRRCGDSWNSCARACAWHSGASRRCCRAYCYCLWVCCIGLSYLFLIGGLVGVLIMYQGSPDMPQEAMGIRDMAVYRNDSAAAPEWPWQVDSRFHVRLSMSNPNTVARCFLCLPPRPSARGVRGANESAAGGAAGVSLRQNADPRTKSATLTNAA